MIRDSGDPSVDELRFVAHVALELGLTDEENKEVQATLSSDGSFDELVGSIKEPEMRLFVFRQVVAAALIDDHINDNEHHYINKAAESFGIDEDLRGAFIAWMHEGMDWERKGATLLEQMRGA